MDFSPYKEILLKMKQEAQSPSDDTIATVLQAERAADEVDIATADSSAALANRLLERQSFYVKRIDVALKKIEDGTYGECEECGAMIAPKRLLARPVALLCVLCKEKQEKKEKKDKVTRGFLSGE
jgi:DnaK suppressor protein